LITIFFRTVILYILVVIALRIMGKAELSELQPYELVILILIAELASIPMEDVRVPLVNGVMSIFTLVFLQILISIINLKSQKARAVICGRPSILIEHGKIIEKEMKSLRINTNDLIEQLRIKNFHNIDDVEYAILETNGELSVIPKSTKRPLITSDLNIYTTPPSLPISLIIDGKVNKDNIKKAQLDLNWLYKELSKYNIKNIDKVLYCAIDEDKKLIIKRREEEIIK